jgi:hypothetical protein
VSAKAWWGFDIDKTTFVDEGNTRGGVIGAPIMPLIRRIKYYLRDNRKVCIVTARVHPSEPDAAMQTLLVRRTLVDVFGEDHAKIDIRCDKDRHMIALFDDRAEQVIPNKGILIREELRRAVAALMVIAQGDGGAGHAAAALMSLDQWSRDLVHTS